MVSFSQRKRITAFESLASHVSVDGVCCLVLEYMTHEGLPRDLGGQLYIRKDTCVVCNPSTRMDCRLRVFARILTSFDNFFVSSKKGLVCGRLSARPQACFTHAKLAAANPTCGGTGVAPTRPNACQLSYLFQCYVTTK